MKRLLLALAASAALAGLAACETATPYQPLAAGNREAGGYSEYRVDQNHWRVTFAGNSLTSRETVERYLLYRAAELTLQQGDDWFVTDERHTDKNTNYYADPDPFYHSGFWGAYGWGWRPYWRYYGPWGWRSWDPWYGDPFWADDVNIHEVSRYQATAEIMMGRGAPPPGTRVFDARDVVRNLGPTLVRPRT